MRGRGLEEILERSGWGRDEARVFVKRPGESFWPDGNPLEAWKCGGARWLARLICHMLGARGGWRGFISRPINNGKIYK